VKGVGVKRMAAGSWLSLMGGELLIEEINDQRGDGTFGMGTVVECDLRGFLLKRDGAMALGDCTRGADEAPFEVLHARYQIGEGDCFPGLELALKYAIPRVPYRMRCSSKFGWGPSGRCATTVGGLDVPAGADLEYEILVTSSHNDDELATPPSAPDDDEQLIGQEAFDQQCSAVNEKALLRKECGNRWFSYKDYSRASRSYSKGVQISEAFLGSIEQPESDSTTPCHRSLVDTRLALLTNLASCHLLTDQFSKARDVCIAVLEFDPGNKKALLRAARASLGLCEYEESKACLTRLLEIDPRNSSAEQELRRCLQAIKASKAKEVAFARGAFGENSTAVASTQPQCTTTATATATTTTATANTDSSKNDEEKPHAFFNNLQTTHIFTAILAVLVGSLVWFYSGLRPSTSSTALQ